jgi:hypothetical protein
VAGGIGDVDGVRLTTWRPYRLRFVPREALLFVIALAAWPQFVSARPQMFSLTLFAWLLFELERFRRGADRSLWRLPLLFAIWVNLHGGWLVGAGVLVIFTVVVFLDRTVELRRRLRLLSAGVVSALATLINPYGPAMLGFLADTVRPERADILEWSPITALPPVIVILMAVPIVLGILAAWRGGRRIPRSSLIICALLALGALRVARLIGFCGIAVGFLLAPFLIAPAGEQSRDAVERAEPGSRSAAWLTEVATAAATIALAVALFGRTITMDGEWLPEPDAVPAIKAHHLRGRMLTWFNYGEYAIWHLWPEITVSNDGRRETVYSEAVRQAHATIYADKTGAVEALKRLDPDHVWLPVESPMIGRLQTAGWTTVFKGPLSVVLTKTRVEGAPTMSRDTSATGRAFPGP